MVGEYGVKGFYGPNSKGYSIAIVRQVSELLLKGCSLAYCDYSCIKDENALALLQKALDKLAEYDKTYCQYANLPHEPKDFIFSCKCMK